MSPRRKKGELRNSYPGGLTAAAALLSAAVFLFIMANVAWLTPWYGVGALLLWAWIVLMVLHVVGLLAIVLRVPPARWLIGWLGLVGFYNRQMLLVWYVILTFVLGTVLLYQGGWSVYFTV